MENTKKKSVVNSDNRPLKDFFSKQLGVREELLFIKSGYVAYSFFIDFLRKNGFDIKISVFHSKLVRALINYGKTPKFIPKKATYYDFTKEEIDCLLQAKKELANFYNS